MDANKLKISLIKEMLYQEIKEYYEITNENRNVESNINALNEMIKLLESEDYEIMMNNYILFDSLIPIFFSESEESSINILKILYNSIYFCLNYVKKPESFSKQDFIKSKENIKKISNKLSKVLEIQTAKLLIKRPQSNEKQITEYKKIITNLKYNKPILPNQYQLLLKLFESKNLTQKQIIILLERIKSHNISTHYANKRKIDNNITHEIINLELLGFEKFEEINWLEDKRKKQLDALIEAVISQGVDEITLQMFPTYKENLTFSDGYDINHIKYFYINLLTYYQNEIIDVQSQLNNLENYLEKESRNFIIELYKEFQKYYLLVRKKMDEEIEKYEIDFKKIKEEEDINKLQYASKATGTTYFESDLKDLEKDTYKSFVDLIIKFKKGKLRPTQTKQLKDPNAGFSEIKDDQLRIIYKHLENNEYLILGVFSKKDNNKIIEYNKICGRKPDIIFKDEDIEEDIFNRITESSHYGGRRNVK